MTLQQIIKQTETLPLEEQKNLASYFIFKFLQLDRNNLIQLFHYNADFVIPEINDKVTEKNRKLDFSGCIDLQGSLDNINVREFAYE